MKKSDIRYPSKRKIGYDGLAAEIEKQFASSVERPQLLITGVLR